MSQTRPPETTPQAPEPHHTDFSGDARFRYALPIGIVVICCLVEAVLLGADWGLWGTFRWRGLSYQYGGFWAGLLADWRPNYIGQPVTMFATHSFLHADAGHLLGNIIALLGLGRAVIDRVGAKGFVWLYALSVIGGALAFAALWPEPAPMIGASGAVFGLAAAWVIWTGEERAAAGLGNHAFWMIPALTLTNYLMWLIMGGQLAWQTHLGGEMAGIFFALLYPRPILENSRS